MGLQVREECIHTVTTYVEDTVLLDPLGDVCASFCNIGSRNSCLIWRLVALGKVTVVDALLLEYTLPFFISC